MSHRFWLLQAFSELFWCRKYNMSSSSLVGAEIDVESLPEAVRGYEYKRHLQSGAFGSVWHAQGPSCGHVAVKVQRKQLHMLAHENDMVRQLSACGAPVLDERAVHCCAHSGTDPWLFCLMFSAFHAGPAPTHRAAAGACHV